MSCMKLASNLESVMRSRSIICCFPKKNKIKIAVATNATTS